MYNASSVLSAAAAAAAVAASRRRSVIYVTAIPPPMTPSAADPERVSAGSRIVLLLYNAVANLHAHGCCPDSAFLLYAFCFLTRSGEIADMIRKTATYDQISGLPADTANRLIFDQWTEE